MRTALKDATHRGAPEPSAPPVRTLPPGTYELDGHVLVRRFAPVAPRNLQCSLSHRVKIHDRPLSCTPQCSFQYSHSDKDRCPSHLYLYRLTRSRYLSLDINRDEADMIHLKQMDLDDVIAQFGLEMPTKPPPQKRYGVSRCDQCVQLDCEYCEHGITVPAAGVPSRALTAVYG